MKVDDLVVGAIYGVSSHYDMPEPQIPRSDVRARLLEKGRTWHESTGYPQTIRATTSNPIVTIEYLPEGRMAEIWAHRIPGAHPEDLALVHPPTEGLVTSVNFKVLCSLDDVS